MERGTVKWYNTTKGFGFILTEEGKDIFVHCSGLDSPFSELQENDSVEFEVKNGQKGLVATNVKVV